MREKILNSTKQFPPGGMGLHGTTYERAGRIREEGLRDMLGNGACFMPLPLQSCWGEGTPKIPKIYERTVGSILYAAGFASRKSFYMSTGQPAIVIFAQWEKYGFRFEKGAASRGGGEHMEERVVGSRNIPYSTWGIGYDSFLPHQWVAGIIHIDEAELEAIYERLRFSFGNRQVHKDEFWEKRDSLIENRLVVKTLTGLERIIRCGAEGPFLEF